MPGRYRFVTRLRDRMRLYTLSNTSQIPLFRFLFRSRNNPNRVNNHDLDKNFHDEIQGKQSKITGYLASSGVFETKWRKLKSIWYDRPSSSYALSGLFVPNDIDSDYLSKYLLKDMTDDDLLKAKWKRFAQKKLLKLGNVSINNKIEVYHRGEYFFQNLWKDIKNAHEQILMETYIMEPDKIAIKTIKLLTDASLRGVSVTLIIDSFGSSAMSIDNNEYINELKRAGGVVLEYNKVKIQRLFEYLFVKQQIPYIFAYRNHKKIIVIDDKYGYTGGMNITGEYCGYIIEGGVNKFRDTHIRLQGDILKYLKESIYYTVLDINPSLPTTQYVADDDDDEDEHIEMDNETDMDIKHDMDPDADVDNVINKGNIDLKEMKDDDVHEDMYKGSMIPVQTKRRLFPIQLLPSFLRPFNGYRKSKNKYLKDTENEYDGIGVDRDGILSKISENRKTWHDTWKETLKDRKKRKYVHEETHKNRLKILASSPRKSLSQWIKYYEDNPGKDGYIRDKSLLEVSALHKLMDEANQTKKFKYNTNVGINDDSNIVSLDNIYIQVLESYRDPRFRLIQRALMDAIDNAISHIFIMNPYFLPPLKLKKKLRAASLRGVDIRIITCDQSDVPFISMASRHIYEELLSKNNIRLFEYEGDKISDNDECDDSYRSANILHAKMCVIDDVFVSLGSFNWDDWSHSKNLEMNLMIVDNNVAKSVHEQFIIDQNQSKEIKLENVRNDRSIIQKCVYYCAYLASRIANRIM